MVASGRPTSQPAGFIALFFCASCTTPRISVSVWLPAGGIRMLSFISFTPGGKSFMYQGWSWISWMLMRWEGSETETCACTQEVVRKRAKLGVYGTRTVYMEVPSPPFQLTCHQDARH